MLCSLIIINVTLLLLIVYAPIESEAFRITGFSTIAQKSNNQQQPQQQYYYCMQHGLYVPPKLRTSVSLSLRKYQKSSSSTSLKAYLPPSGDGGNNNDPKSQLISIVSSVVTLGAVVLFFLSPLGAVFFTVVNSLFILVLLLPILGIVGFNIWQYFNTISGVCPNCAAPITALKDSTPTICLNCGTIVQVVNDEIYIANPNNIGGKIQDDPILSIFQEDPSPWFTGGIPSPFANQNEKDTYDAMKKAKVRSTTIIDVDAEREDK